MTDKIEVNNDRKLGHIKLANESQTPEFLKDKRFYYEPLFGKMKDDNYYRAFNLDTLNL